MLMGKGVSIQGEGSRLLMLIVLKIWNSWIAMLENSRLMEFRYKNRILEVVGKLVGKVAELDFNTDSKTRGRFLRMVIFVNIEKLLVSQVLVVGDLIWVEYEALSTICLSCEIYGHLKEMCISPKVEKSLEIGKTNDKSEPANLTSGGEILTFRLWIMVE
ncbi:hypothetical protein Gotur_029944 [Gossypium turneri]